MTYLWKLKKEWAEKLSKKFKNSIFDSFIQVFNVSWLFLWQVVQSLEVNFLCYQYNIMKMIQKVI